MTTHQIGLLPIVNGLPIILIYRYGAVATAKHDENQAGSSSGYTAFLDPFPLTVGAVGSALDISMSISATSDIHPGTLEPIITSFQSGDFEVNGVRGIHIEGRLSPGAISDPFTFWTAPPPGTLTLFEGVIAESSPGVLDADLVYGENTGDFALDFARPARVVEQEIVDSFGLVDGQWELLSGIDEIFPIDLAITTLRPEVEGLDYTVGLRMEVVAQAIGVPEPATLSLLVVGGLVAKRRRRR